MKKLILILIFFIILPSTLAICCEDKPGKEGGCYPGRPICCIQGDKNVGYIGCKYATTENPQTEEDFGYKCPSEYLGNGDGTACLQCSEDCRPYGTDCDWIETDMCEEANCYVEYFDDEFPISSGCSFKCGEGEIFDEGEQKCIEVENINDATCTNDMCMPNKWCCNKNGKFEQGKTTLCSGDNDKDEICNYYDTCPDTPNSETLGTCLPLTIKKTCTEYADCGQGGHCSNTQDDDSNYDGIGDACQYEVSCDSEYGDRQCCDELDPYATPADKSTFFGFIGHCTKESLGDVFRGIGCWSKCAIKDASGKEITSFEISPCIDGKRTVKKLQNGVVIETKTEACSGIPLIPFFTNINLFFTLLILTLFYYFREK